jgi:hypothetical protein
MRRRGHLALSGLLVLGLVALAPTGAEAPGPAAVRLTPATAPVPAPFAVGTRQIQWRLCHRAILTRTGRADAEIDGLDYADPAARGLIDQLSGRAPRSAEEIALGATFAHEARMRLGDRLPSPLTGRPLTVVGIVADRGLAAAYVLPTAIPLHAPGTEVRWLIHSPEPATALADGQRSAAGFRTLAPGVYLSPLVPDQNSALANARRAGPTRGSSGPRMSKYSTSRSRTVSRSSPLARRNVASKRSKAASTSPPDSA